MPDLTVLIKKTENLRLHVARISGHNEDLEIVLFISAHCKKRHLPSSDANQGLGSPVGLYVPQRKEQELVLPPGSLLSTTWKT